MATKGRQVTDFSGWFSRAATRALLLALLALAAPLSAAAQDPQTQYRIGRVTPIIAEGADLGWFTARGGDGAAIGAFVGQAVVQGVKAGFRGRSPLNLDVRILTFQPKPKDGGGLFGGGHKVTVEFVLKGPGGDVLTRSEQNMDLWSQAFSGGRSEEQRLADYMSLRTQEWIGSLSCSRMRCPSPGADAGGATPGPELALAPESGAAAPRPRPVAASASSEPRRIAKPAPPRYALSSRRDRFDPSPLDGGVRRAPFDASVFTTARAPAGLTAFSLDEGAIPAGAGGRNVIVIGETVEEETELAAIVVEDGSTAGTRAAPALVLEESPRPEPQPELSLEQPSQPAPAADPSPERTATADTGSQSFFPSAFDDGGVAVAAPAPRKEPELKLPPKPRVSAVFDLSGALAADE